MPERGPAVFLDYDQAALDAAYDQAAYAANREQLIQRRIGGYGPNGRNTTQPTANMIIKITKAGV